MLLNKFKAIFLFFLFSFVGDKPEDPFLIIRNNSPVVAFQTLIEKNLHGDFQSLQSQYYQALGTLYSYTGKYAEAKALFVKNDSVMHQQRKIQFEQLDIDNRLNADTMMSQLAERFNIIAFNEEHHVPMARAVVFHYLRTLAEHGYRYLALEALNEQDTLLHERGYAEYQKTGYYTDEPIFGNLIRYALKLGYKLIPYDYYDSVKSREKDQATNIVKQYHPEEGKLIILGGYSHICESEEKSMMGYYLKSVLNEDILTIKLTGASDYTQQLDSSFTKPILVPYKKEFGFDYQYFVPPTYNNIVMDNIPLWYIDLLGFPLRETDLKKEFPDSYESFSAPYLIRLTKVSERAGVPIFQSLVTNVKQQKIMLPILEPGVYELMVQMTKEKFFKTIRI